jgi:hypothetical protein
MTYLKQQCLAVLDLVMQVRRHVARRCHCKPASGRQVQVHASVVQAHTTLALVVATKANSIARVFLELLTLLRLLSLHL